MSIQLLSAAAAGVTGQAIDVRSVTYNFNQMRVSTTGGYTVQKVIVEHSPDGGLTWIDLSSGGLANATDLLIPAPVDLIRARTVAGQVGSASAWLMTST